LFSDPLQICVNLNLPIRTEAKAEAVTVLRAVDEERRYVMQATIIRIMKARTVSSLVAQVAPLMILYITQTLKNQALISEVISQVSTGFTPKISDIKKAIESLLDKDYLERVEGQHDVSAVEWIDSWSHAYRI